MKNISAITSLFVGLYIAYMVFRTLREPKPLQRFTLGVISLLVTYAICSYVYFRLHA